MTKILYIHIPRCIGIGRTGDGVLKHRTTSKRLILERARCVEFCHISSGWFKHIEPHRTPSKHMILECRVLSRFEGVEPLGNSVQVPYTTCYHCEDEVREGSVQSNHSELTSKTSTHLAFSALKWFEKVRGGSRGLNHSETVYRYPTHLVTTV